MMIFQTTRPRLLSAGLAAALLLVGLPATAEDGVSPGRILLGQSAAFEGPASALGLGMRLGLQAAFTEANAAGGVHGRQIELLSYDDGYEPDKAIANTEKLIHEDGVFAIVGGVGTPTSAAAEPIARGAGVPFIGPFTGAGFLRAEENRHVVNVRGSYDQETEAWIQHLTDDLGSQRIAILYQDDSFGRAGLSGVTKAMEKRNLSLVAEGTYKRNTTAVKSALLAIRKADPDAVVMVGAYRPIAEFIRLAHKLRMDATFVTISFVGSKALAEELGKEGKGVVITQVVPFPEDATLPLVDRYRKALAVVDADAEPGFVSLEGYMVGRLMVQALEGIDGEPTREGLIDAIQSRGEYDLDGVSLTFGPGDNQGMDRVYLSVMQEDGTFAYVDNLDD